jgi:dTDP-4-dehydrorhamnose 3,5-epimerase
MHYQEPPRAEEKLVRCTVGAIYDVIIDLRPESGTYREWFSLEISSSNRLILYVPKGFAHGFLTLEDNTEVFYQISEYYSPEHARGVRWNDPVFGIRWPTEPRVISERDRSYPHYVEK